MYLMFKRDSCCLSYKTFQCTGTASFACASLELIAAVRPVTNEFKLYTPTGLRCIGTFWLNSPVTEVLTLNPTTEGSEGIFGVAVLRISLSPVNSSPRDKVRGVSVGVTSSLSVRLCQVTQKTSSFSERAGDETNETFRAVDVHSLR
jgi:hypothetical protein